MRREQPIFKDFDLPTQHLSGEHYRPPKARLAEEIERRKRLPRGSLLAEQQEKGIRVASHILHGLTAPADVRFASRLLAASGMNTAWYEFARGADYEVQRRRLKLPLLIASKPEWRPSSDEVLREGTGLFEEAADFAGKLVTCVEYRSPRTADFKKIVGRTLGKASLTVACVPMADEVANNPFITDADIQLLVRQRGLKTLTDARGLAHEIGSNPSIAQLANPDSDLGVYWRRESPNEALNAYKQAMEIVVE